MKQRLLAVVRRLGLLRAADEVLYLKAKVQNRKENQAFRAAHPDVVLPPDDLMYESFQLNYERYYTESKEAAAWMAGWYKKWRSNETITLLDWGCGPGRIIRHMPALFSAGSEIHGTDYNARSIAWCREHLPGIHFNHNGTEAKLPYADGTFDFIYGISIFTHLSEERHRTWMEELLRVLKPGGVMVQTTHGDHFRQKLTAEELKHYDAGQLVVRSHVKEGHRTFAAFQPPAYMRQLLGSANVLEHIVRPLVPGRALPQDVWVIEKPA